MAEAKNTAAPADAPVKKKRAPQVRKPKVLNALLTIDESGAPSVLIASYDAMKLLKGVKENPSAFLVEITPA